MTVLHVTINTSIFSQTTVRTSTDFTILFSPWRHTFQNSILINSFWILHMTFTPSYQYCNRSKLTPFIDLNHTHTGQFTYEDASTMDLDGSFFYELDSYTYKGNYEILKHQSKSGFPKAERKRDCFYMPPYSPAKYDMRNYRPLQLYNCNQIRFLLISIHTLICFKQ